MQILCTKRLSYNPDTYIERNNEYPFTSSWASNYVRSIKIYNTFLVEKHNHDLDDDVGWLVGWWRLLLPSVYEGKSGNKIVYYFLWLWFFTWDNPLEMCFGRVTWQKIKVITGGWFPFDVCFRCLLHFQTAHVGVVVILIDYCNLLLHLPQS